MIQSKRLTGGIQEETLIDNSSRFFESKNEKGRSSNQDDALCTKYLTNSQLPIGSDRNSVLDPEWINT